MNVKIQKGSDKKTPTTVTVEKSGNVYSPSELLTLVLPRKYRITDRWSIVETHEKPKSDDDNEVDNATYETSVCPNAILITGRLKSDNGNEKLVILYHRDGDWHEYAIPKSDLYSTRNIVSTLGAKGCMVNALNAKAVLKYITDFELRNSNVIPIIHTIGNCGWIDNKTFFPNRAPGYMYDAETVNASIAQGLSASGGLKEWVDIINKYRNNKVFRFMLSSSLAAPMLRVVGARGFAAYLWCSSGKGKTACLKAALSAWGNPDKIACTFNSTRVGLERLASFFNDLPLGIDERQSAGSGDNGQSQLEEIVYMLINGTGKVRGSKVGGLQDISEWKTIIIATGEEPIVVQSTMDGVANRCIELKDPPFVEGTDISQVYNDVGAIYGTAGYAFIDTIIQVGAEKISAMYRDMQTYIQDYANIANKSHISDIALVAVADMLSSEYIFGDSHEEAIKNAKTLAIYVAGENSNNSKRDVNIEALDHIRAWIASNANAIRGLGDSDTHYLHYGFINKNNSNGDEICLFPSNLKKELESNGYRYDKTMRYLRENGYIVTENGKNTVWRSDKCSKDKTRVVCLLRDKLNDLSSELRRVQEEPSGEIPQYMSFSGFEELGPDDELPF